MGFFEKIAETLRDKKKPGLSALEILKYIGPGLLVTVGFIDPGNWAANVAAGSDYGYRLLWILTLGTVMLIILQHNAAHLGIATGTCLAEASSAHLPKAVSWPVLGTALVASCSTALAELFGGAIALNMLFRIPLKIGAVLVTGFVLWMLFSNSYRKLEKWIIGFVSLIGLAFVVELFLVKPDWRQALPALVVPSIPAGAMVIVMSVLGAVVMPHNLFLHSEVIQSRQWNLKDPTVIKHQLRYEFADTLVSMGIGWVINASMVIVAAAAFFSHGIKVTQLSQAEQLLTPLVDEASALIFAVALLFSGLASSVTAALAGGTIYSGIVGENFDLHDNHSRIGIVITLLGALIAIFFITDPFKGLLYSQLALSIQLPITVFLQIWLTSSKKVMGDWVNSRGYTALLLLVGIAILVLNVLLVVNP